MSEPAIVLRARLRRLAVTPRVRDCGRRSIGDPAIVVYQDAAGARSAHWTGVLTCGRQHSCPTCALKRSAERAGELTRLFSHGERWEAPTFTVPHRSHETLAESLARLVDGYRRTRAHRAVREIFTRRVLATARALEVRDGTNGWHPHYHAAWLSSEWTDEEKSTLSRVWSESTGASAERGVVWSDPITVSNQKRYFTKMGAEMALGEAKAGKLGSLSPFQLAARAVQDPRAVARWQEYQRTMRGRRVLELDERAKRLALEGEPAEREPIARVSVYAEELRGLASLEASEPGILFEALTQATIPGGDPELDVRGWLDSWLATLVHAPGFAGWPERVA